MRLQFTEDSKLVEYILNHKDIICIAEDNVPKITAKHVDNLHDQYMFFAVYDDSDKPVGLFACHDVEDGLEVHINMIKEGRGATAVEAAKQFIQDIFTRTIYTKLIANVPVKYMNVLSFVSKLGFKMEELTEKNYTKDGVEYDTIKFSLTKE